MADIKNVYRLELVHKESNKTLSLYPGLLASDIEINSKKFNLSLNSLHFTKRVYEPCHVSADIKIAIGTGSSELPTVEKTVEYFKAFSSVNLKVGKVESSGPGGHKTVYKEDVGVLGKGYVIMDTKPVYRMGGGQTAMSVLLDIYSPDFFFTRRQYSQTYLGKRLSDLIDTGVTDFGLSNVLSVSHNHLSYLSYIDKSDNKTKRELIQPYLVQYNESFYELLARTANRCGEWLYYEGGKLFLGWDSKSTDIKTKDLNNSDIQSATFRSRGDERASAKNTFYGRNPAVSDSTSPSSWNYNMEMAADEYLAPLTKGAFDDSSGWRNLRTSLFSQFLAKMFSCDTLYKGIVDYLFIVAKSELTILQRVKMSNDTNNKTYFEGDAAKDTELEHFDDKPADAKTTTPFSTNPSYKNREDGYTTDLNLALYKKVREQQLELNAKSLDVDFGGKIRNIAVGDIIRVVSVSSDLYMVTEVVGADETVGDARAETMSIRAVPIDKDKKAVFPPAREQDYVPRGGQQTAFITSSEDPLRQGRVRIRFAWEKSDSLGSPWIRMSMPFASKNDAGLFITPQKGDEVLVDFAGGNMERPVVVGSLYNSSNQPPYGQRVYHSVFRSPGGHAIKTADGSDIMAFVGGIIPAIGLLRSFCPYIKSTLSADSNSRKLLGAMEFTDEYGIYNLTLDSAKRQISIESPFGDVNINAFTGITINAPNGDVKIIGKNVEIRANNNLKLVSGQNIKNKTISQAIRKGEFSASDLAAEVGKAFFVDNLAKKALDFSLLRTVIDSFLKPIEGTLSIKSNRFMKLEAGNGSAHIPSDACRSQVAASGTGEKFGKLFGKREITLRKLGRSVKYINDYTDAINGAYKTKYNEIVNSKTTINDQLQQVFNNNVPDANKIEHVIERGLDDNSQDYTFDDLMNAVAPENRPGIDEQAVRTLLEPLNEFVHDIKKFRPKTLFKPSTFRPDNENNVFLSKIDGFYDAINNAAQFPFISNKNDETFAQALNMVDQAADTAARKRLMRLLTVKLIENVKDDAQLTYTVPDPDQANHGTVKGHLESGDQDVSEQDWGKFVRRLSKSENITDNDIQADASKSVLVSVLGGLPFFKASDRVSYQPDGGQGRILLSDNGQGRTLQIENGAFVEYDNKGYEQVLKQIKEACGVPEVAPAVPGGDGVGEEGDDGADGGDDAA